MTDFRILLAPATALLAVFLGAPLLAQGQSSLYTDPTAAEPGDVLTVILDEQTSAQRESSYEGNSSTSVSGSGGASGPGLGSQFGADAQIENQTNNSNQTVQSGTLTGTLTVRVVEVNEAGNLVVSGERDLTVNGATHVMEVSGIVRTSDVRHDNTVLSHQIADAKIKYNQSGMRHNGFFSKGFLLKAGSAVIVGISIFLGLN
ncbi:MAG: flagellar basal body L-ring protein FlgH [Salinibacter sp.]